ncbi:MAG: EamA family transporter [Cytophagales bacterium]|nr:MAG: EamA family transporter [Cytophagales bacterium]TAF59783.1 MAG: EamA family transporter [Cytophagales bacterium]
MITNTAAQNDSWKAQLKLHFIVLIWGSTAIVGKWIGLDTAWLVWYRTMIATLGLAFLVWFYKASFRVEARSLVIMLLTGCVVCGHWFLFFFSAKVSNVSICLIGLSTTTLWTALLGPLINRTRPQWYEFLLGLLVVSGLLVIFRFESGKLIGLFLGIGSAFCGALFSLLNGVLVKRNNSYTLSFYEMLAAYVLVAVYLMASGGLGTWQENIPNPQEILALLFLGGVCTVYAFAACVELYRKISVFASNLAINLEPVYGIVMAIFFFQEHQEMSIEFYLGASIIVLAVLAYPFLVSFEKRRLDKKANR